VVPTGTGSVRHFWPATPWLFALTLVRSIAQTPRVAHLVTRALQSSAARALSQMSARSAKGSGALAQLVRDRQDLVGRRAVEDKHLLAAVGRGDAPASETARKNVASLDAALDVLDGRLSSDFKEYAELSNPKPLTITAAQALLSDGEALVLFLDVPQFGNLSGRP
jgi:hypothetical protein